MLLMMLERGEDIHSVVFFDTGWEFPEMIDHINKLEVYADIEIIRLKHKFSFDYLLNRKPIIARKGQKKGRIHRMGNGWPSMFRRWCTGRKTNEIKKYYKKQKDFVSCIGFAADEAKRVPVKNKKKWPERYPLIEFDIGEKQALEYCYNKGFDWGGLYELFGRVSCFCCPLQRIGELRNLRKHRPELWQKMLEMDIPLINQGRDFKGGRTVHDFENKFSIEDRQMTMFEDA
jgi:3'-phosphoadenosine 5'-phosphosulfate sulfotransferase (PAPS reductase)/FAD synthetase